MSQCIEIVVCHHLGFAAGAAGEIHEHGIVVVVLFGAHKGGRIHPFLMPVVETLSLARTNAHQRLESGTLGLGTDHLLHNILFAGADDGLHAGAVVAVYDIVCCEHVCGGNGHSPYLVQCEHGEPELIASLENEHHHIAAANAEAHEIGSCAVALLFDILE